MAEKLVKSMTQKRLAEETKIYVTHLSMVKNGKDTPSLKLVYQIADKLDVEVKDLFTF